MNLGLGGIDKQVEDKKDMMRANPQQQNTVGQDLIGVMALQKLQREKKAAENELNLAMNKSPGTLKEQLENELSGMTQNEMTTQTQGIMAQRQQKQQQQQQRPPQPRPQGIQQAARPPMGGAPRPPMGGAPRPPMGGAPRPPMGGAPRPPMMASGGIVGFANGGSTVDRGYEAGASKGGYRVQALTEVLKEMGLTHKQFDALPVAQKQVVYAEVPAKMKQLEGKRADYETPAKRTRDWGARIQDRARESAAHVPKVAQNVGQGFNTGLQSGTSPTQIPTGGIKTLVDQNVDQNNVEDTYRDAQAQYGSTGGPPKVGGTGTGTGIADLASLARHGAVPGDQQAISTTQASDLLPTAVKTQLDTSLGADPREEAKLERADASKDYNLEEGRKTLQAKRDAHEAEQLRLMNDPNEKRKRKWRAAQIGTGGGIAGAQARNQNREDQAQLDFLRDRADTYAADMKADVEKLKAIDTRAATVLQMVAADRLAAMNAFSDLTIANSQAVTAAEDRFSRENTSILNAYVATKKVESETALQQAIYASNDKQFVTDTLKEIRQSKVDAKNEYMASLAYNRAPLKSEYITNEQGEKQIVEPWGQDALLLKHMLEQEALWEDLEKAAMTKFSELWGTPVPSFDGTGGSAVDVSESEAAIINKG